MCIYGPRGPPTGPIDIIANSYELLRQEKNRNFYFFYNDDVPKTADDVNDNTHSMSDG